MRKAFIILAHNKPEQLNIFIDQILKDLESDVYIHVNKLCEDIIPRIKSDCRVHISKNNIPIHWGSDEVLKAILILLREIKSSSIEYRYFCICTGQDLLIRKGLDKFLSEHDGEVFIDCDNSDEAYFQKYQKARLMYKWPEICRRKYDFRYHPFRILRSVLFRIYMKEPKLFRKTIEGDTSNLVFYKDWWQCALPNDVVDYMLGLMSKQPEIWDLYKNAYIPEEGFFTTIIMNSEFADRIRFDNGKSRALTYRAAEENDHPRILLYKDITALEKSGCFFARKFDMSVDKEIVEYFSRIVE